MNTLIISYDLKRQNTNYEQLYETIKEANGWWHYLDSFWIIVSEKNASQWADILKSKIDNDDSLIIIEVQKGSTNGWLPQRAWDWINKNTSIE